MMINLKWCRTSACEWIVIIGMRTYYNECLNINVKTFTLNSSKVCFPTGVGNLAAAQVANAMMDALANFAIDLPVFLKTVQIVIFQSTMLSDFEDAMKKFKRISPKPFSGKLCIAHWPLRHMKQYSTWYLKICNQQCYIFVRSVQ